MVYTYAFWYILSKITAPDVIGISSSIISIGVILTVLASVGVPIGSQRFLGRFFQEQKIEDVKMFVVVSIIIVVIGILACSTFILATRAWLLHLYDLELILILIVLTSSSTVSLLFRNIIISSLETKKLLTASIVSSTVKLVLAVILVSAGTNETGVLIGFSVAPVLSAILFAFSIKSFFKEVTKKASLKFYHCFRLLLGSSVVSWIPSLTDSVGTQMGTIILLGIQGSAHAGVYYVAFQITMGMLTVIWAIYSVLFPALSAMDEGRRQFFSRSIKIGLIIILPFSSPLVFNSFEVMELFGSNYVEGSSALQILLLSLFPTTVTVAISFLMYSYGRYKEVLMIGLALSIPRIFLYFIFITWLGSIGTALSYTTGSIVGFILSLFIAKRITLTMFWKDLTLIFLTSMASAFLLSNLRLHFVLYIFLSIICTYMLLLKFMILNRNDVRDCLSLLPPNIANPIINTVNKVGSRLSKNY